MVLPHHRGVVARQAAVGVPQVLVAFPAEADPLAVVEALGVGKCFYLEKR